jgi:hypothetical protein
MSTLVLRSVKGSALTSSEIDANVTNLNNDKADKASPTFTGAVTLPTNVIPITASQYPTIRPTLDLDFANSGTVDPRITFARATTATYYDGKTTAMAEQNLLTYSQDFSNGGWVKGATILTPNTTVAPDGSLTADTATTTSNSVPTVRAILDILADTPHTFSVYIKATTQRYILVGIAEGLNSAFVIVDTLNWVITDARKEGTGTYISSDLVPSTNGFYRVSLTGIASASATGCGPQVRPCDTATSTTHNVSITNSPTDYIFWGAQLEQRSSATAYTPTTTAAITNYIPVLMTAPSGVPRLDYNPVTGEALGLLIEEQRTNLLTYSSNFSNWVWAKSNCTITSNADVSPDGNINATKVIIASEQAAGNISNLWRNYVTASTSVFSSSIYVKAGEWTALYLLARNQTNTVTNSTINLLDGSVPLNNHNVITYYMGNGWYRITTLHRSTSGAIRLYWSGLLNTVSNGIGDGYSGIYIWGAQLEEGPFATSYIPTTSAQVTRNADRASMTGTNFSSWYNQSQGSVYIESDCVVSAGLSGLYRSFSLSNNSSFYQINQGQVYEYYAGGYVFNSSINSTGKAATSIKNGAMAAVFNGGSASTSTGVFSGSVYNTLCIGSGPFTSVNFLNGHIRKLSYYPQALSSANLVALTS